MRLLSCGLFLVALTILGMPVPGATAEEFKLEPGFKLLFNGKDLTGWKQKKDGESLDGKTEAYNGRFKVMDGMLVIDPKVKGDVRIETTKPVSKEVHIKFEFLPDSKCNNDLFLLGSKFDLTKSNVKDLKEGEWNQFEITAKDGKVEFKNNGEVQRTDKVKSDKPTPFEIRAEFGAIQVRRLRIKDMP
jgi:hypothetical protein